MIAKEKIQEIIEPIIKEKDAFIVDIKVSTSNKINIEIDSLKGFTINDCVELSRFVESKLNRDEEDFELEVASAGLSEPFKVYQQYQKNVGNEVESILKDGKKIKGTLADVDDKGFVIEEGKKVKIEGKKKKQEVIEKHSFAFDQIKSTKVVLKFK